MSSKGIASVRGFALRKLLLLSFVIVGLVAPSAANATITQVFGSVSCTTQGPGVSEGQRWCGSTAGTTVPSWDGTPIDVTVNFPAATGPDNNYPVVGIYHGWGGSKITGSSSAAQRWLDQGYATFSITDRGWFSSCGAKVAKEQPGPCEKGYVHLMSRAYEVRDVQYLLGLLADEGLINPQEIGATGESYGGGMSSQLGSLKDRVQLQDGELIPWVSPKGTPLKIAATAPEWPWTDLAQSLQPNGSNLDYVAEAPYSGMLGNHEYGIQKQNWNESLYLAGLLVYGAFYAPSPAEPEANISEWYSFNGTGGPYNGKPLAIQQETQLPNHGAYYTPLNEPPAPALLQNGWNDDLFPVNEAVDYYNKVRSTYPNAPIQLFDLDYGHNPRSTTTPSTTDVGKLTAAQNAWFEYYVKGQGAEPANAHGGVTAITSVCPVGASSSGHEYKAANWASLAPGEIRLEGAAEQTIQAPGTAPATAFTSGTICTTQAAGNNASAATYKLTPAPAGGFTIAGSPTVIAEFNTPATNDQVIARLYDVNEASGGTQELIGRAIYRPINPGGGFTKQVFQLHPQAWNVAAGHVVKLELLMQDSKYARTSSSPASIPVKNLELRLPSTEAPGSDGGLVQAPAPKYLPPGYSFALDEHPPAVVTEPATSVTQTSATLNATVNPEGVTVSDCHFEYGTTEAYGTSVPCSSLPGSGTSPVAVSASVAGLKANTQYHFRISATNVNGTSTGSDQAFTTLPNAPAVVTEPASSVTQTSANLNATVNPEGANVSDCHFEYGTTALYGTSVPCSSLPGSGESPVAVSASLSLGALSENTTYHYRIVATNTSGTSYGSDVSFTTLPNAPAVVTEAASSVTQTSATLNGSVNPQGGNVSSCSFEYGTTESYGSSVACSPSPGAGEAPVLVSASVGGLASNTTYHFRIVATNPGGTSYGSDNSFTTLPPPSPAHWFKSGTKLKQGTVVPVIYWGTAVNVSLSSGAGVINCKTVSSGNIENPVGGGSGVGQTLAADYYECKQPKCESEIAESPLGGLGYRGVGFAQAYNLPWNDQITGSAPNIEERIGAPAGGNLGQGFAEGYPASSQAPDGQGTAWGSKGAIGLIAGCQIYPNPEGAPALGGVSGSPSRVASETPFEGELRPEIGGSLNGAVSASNPAQIRFAGSASGELQDNLGPGNGGVGSGNLKYLGYATQSPIKVE